jgi:hypothetical protein
LVRLKLLVPLANPTKPVVPVGGVAYNVGLNGNGVKYLALRGSDLEFIKFMIVALVQISSVLLRINW